MHLLSQNLPQLLSGLSFLLIKVPLSQQLQTNKQTNLLLLSLLIPFSIQPLGATLPTYDTSFSVPIPPVSLCEKPAAKFHLGLFLNENHQTGEKKKGQFRSLLGNKSIIFSCQTASLLLFLSLLFLKLKSKVESENFIFGSCQQFPLKKISSDRKYEWLQKIFFCDILTSCFCDKFALLSSTELNQRRMSEAT